MGITRTLLSWWLIRWLCQREHGVTSYLAHNMTVTLRNLDEVASVVRDGARVRSCGGGR